MLLNKYVYEEYKNKLVRHKTNFSFRYGVKYEINH